MTGKTSQQKEDNLRSNCSPDIFFLCCLGQITSSPQFSVSLYINEGLGLDNLRSLQLSSYDPLGEEILGSSVDRGPTQSNIRSLEDVISPRGKWRPIGGGRGVDLFLGPGMSPRCFPSGTIKSSILHFVSLSQRLFSFCCGNQIPKVPGETLSGGPSHRITPRLNPIQINPKCCSPAVLGHR